MNPYAFVAEATITNKSLLSLFSGIGLEFYALHTTNVTAVDICPVYIAELQKRYPFVKAIVSDALDFLKKCDDNSYDVVTCIDGLEHITKDRGKELLEQMKRVAKEKCLVFTPEGYLKNEPHAAWDIEGGDKYQIHLSGWIPSELAEFGFTVINRTNNLTSQHGDKYNEVMYEWRKLG